MLKKRINTLLCLGNLIVNSRLLHMVHDANDFDYCVIITERVNLSKHPDS